MEYNSSLGYQTIKSNLKEWLKTFGFQSHGANTFYRIKGDTLQVMNLQKGVGHLDKQMTINVVLKGLFVPKCGFETLQPGGRIGQFTKSEKDKWWNCETQEKTADSIIDIKQAIEFTVTSFYDRFQSPDSTLEVITDPQFDFIWQNAFTFIDKGFFFLYCGRFSQALDTFESRQPSKVSKYKTITSLIEQNDSEGIHKLLNENIRYNKEHLKTLANVGGEFSGTSKK